MADLSGLHAQARRLILSLRSGLERLEVQEQSAVHGPSAALSKDLLQKLSDLQKTSAEMDSIWRMQVMRESTSKRDIWKRKVEQVAEEADALSGALARHDHRTRRRAAEEAERAELLERRANGVDWRAVADEEAAAQGYVANSRRVLEEAFQTGTSILGSMAGQRERMKSAQRKMLDVLNSVGLSDSLLRVIDRRQRMDKWITYGGMILVSLLLVAVWWFYKR